MSVEIACSQAIFTSARTPMGEGYRVIAASKGVRADDKQIITRVSPSHESLCIPQSLTPVKPGPRSAVPAEIVAALVETISATAPAVAFYSLADGRLCVSTSCHAGAEHTGRGGQRVFTRAVIFLEADFARIEYNPLNIVRAMIAAGLTVPDLKPPTVLPDLTIRIDCNGAGPSAFRPANGFDVESAGRVLRGLLDARAFLVNVGWEWAAWTEAVILAVPGPLRAGLSLSIGLRHSVGRSHRLQVFRDDKSATRTKVAGTGTEYVDAGISPRGAKAVSSATPAPRAVAPGSPGTRPSAWVGLVTRHWTNGDLSGLSRRTSRPFQEFDAAARERIGALYLTLDDLPNCETPTVLAAGVDHLGRAGVGVEAEIIGEIIIAAQRVLLRRFNEVAWKDVDRLWPAVVNTWRQSAQGTAFAWPLIEQILRSLARKEHAAAASAALAVGRAVPSSIDSLAHGRLIDEVLERLARWLESRLSTEQVLECTTETQFAGGLRRIVQEWRQLRPSCPIVRRIAMAAEEHLGLAVGCKSAT